MDQIRSETIICGSMKDYKIDKLYRSDRNTGRLNCADLICCTLLIYQNSEVQHNS